MPGSYPLNERKSLQSRVSLVKIMILSGQGDDENKIVSIVEGRFSSLCVVRALAELVGHRTYERAD